MMFPPQAFNNGMMGAQQSFKGFGKAGGKPKGLGKGAKGRGHAMMGVPPGGGMFPPQQPMAQQKQQLEALEGQFGSKADEMLMSLVDLGVPRTAIEMEFTKLMHLRDEIASLYGVPWVSQQRPIGHQGGMGMGLGGMGGMGGMMGGMGMGGLPAPAEINWKTELHQICQQKKIQASFQYNTEQTADSVAAGGAPTWYASLTCEQFREVYTGDVPGTNKKLAEQTAAKVALAAEFPEHFVALEQKLAVAGSPIAALQDQRGKKRKAPGNDGMNAQAEISGVQQLFHYMTFIVNGACKKGEDLVFEVVETSEGSNEFQGTVKLVSHDGSVYQGEIICAGPGGPNAKEAKKQAEHSAALAAVAALEPIVAPKIAEAEGRKKDKYRKSLETLKERKAQQKADKQALRGDGELSFGAEAGDGDVGDENATGEEM